MPKPCSAGSKKTIENGCSDEDDDTDTTSESDPARHRNRSSRSTPCGTRRSGKPLSTDGIVRPFDAKQTRIHDREVKSAVLLRGTLVPRIGIAHEGEVIAARRAPAKSFVIILCMAVTDVISTAKALFLIVSRIGVPQ